MSDPKYTTVDLDEIAGRAAHVTEYVTVPDADADRLVEQVTSVDVPALVAEVERLREELGDARGALAYIEYQLSKHAQHYGGDIEDACDTARAALAEPAPDEQQGDA